jgi:protoporphyrinogen oxidase
MITILGAGLAGLSAAYHLGDGYRVLEREAEPGGLCRSVEKSGYVFDIAPHILFTRDEYARGLFIKLLEGNLLTHDRQAYIYMMGTYVKYPFEANLHPLPREAREECIQGVVDRPTLKPRNFMEWIQSSFGEGIAKYYMVPYNEKIWKYPLDKMNTEWLGGRVPTPSVEEMRRGAEGDQNVDYGPNAQFWYPESGGIGALPKALAEGLDVSCGSNAVDVKPTKKGVKVTYQRNGLPKSVESEYAFSSLPLPELVKIMSDVPEAVVKAANRLVYNSIICVDVGVKRPGITDKHWLYFPEPKLVFNRISFPMNFSPGTTPPGRSSVLVEVTYRGRQPDLEETKERVLHDLVEAELTKESDKVEVCDASSYRYAYVIYDLDHRKNVEAVHRYLRESRVIPIGRFGEWEYYNMDKAILSGKRAAESLPGD